MKANNQPWTERTRQLTRELFQEMSINPITHSLHFKHRDGRYARIRLDDLLAQRATLVIVPGQEVIIFENIESLIDAGWVVD
jgi:hypothetical protein